MSSLDLFENIKQVGDKIRNLKLEKSSKDIIDAQVKILQELKKEFKTLTGEEWKSQESSASTPRSSVVS